MSSYNFCISKKVHLQKANREHSQKSYRNPVLAGLFGAESCLSVLDIWEKQPFSPRHLADFIKMC